MTSTDKRATTEPSVQPRRERRDAAAHSQQILVAARELFVTRGVDVTSMHDVARAAGVGQATLYRRYAHKGELCQSLLSTNLARFQAEVAALIAMSGELPALELLFRVLERQIHFNEESALLLHAIVDSACGPRRRELYSNPFYSWIRTTNLGLLRRAIDQGEAAPIDAEIAIDIVLAPFAIDLYMHQREVLGYSSAQIIATARQLLLHGLCVRQ